MLINRRGVAGANAPVTARWMVIALCLALLLTAQAGRAQIVSASAVPGSLPVSGGNVTVRVVVNSAVAVSSVAAYANGGSIGGLSAAGTDASGNKIYSSVFAVGANVTTLPRSFVYTVAVTDTASHVTNGSAGTVDQATPNALKITSATLATSALPAGGGSYMVSVVATVPAPNTISNFYVYANGSGQGYLNYISTNADGSLNYSGTFNLAQNVSNAPHPYQVIVNGTDNAGNRAVAVAGVVTVSNATAASVVSSSLSINTLPAAGGAVTMTAVISAPAPNDVSDLYAFRYNSGLGGLSYISSNADKTKNFSGTFTFPSNVSDTPIIYPVVLRLRDNASNAVTVPVGYVTVNPVTPIKILSVSASTSSQTATGGNITFTATALAPAPNDVSDVYAYNYTQALVSLSYQSTNADGSKVYSGTYTNTTNATNATLVKYLLIRARDNAGNQITKPVGTLKIAPQTPITVVSATLTPNNITAAGGTVTVNATVLAPAPNDVSSLRLYRYDQQIGSLNYISTNADGSKVYSGVFNVAANASNATQIYPYTLYAYDNSNNYAYKSLGNVTVPAAANIKIVSASLSGTAVPAAGGNLTATVTVLAPAPNEVSSVIVYHYGSGNSLSYVSTNADGSKVYSGPVILPAQSGSYANTYLISVQARDNISNYAYTFLPNVTVGTAPTPDPVAITNASVSATSFPVVGGNVIIKATVKPAIAGTISSVQAYNYEFYQGNLIYQSSNADGSLNYSGSFAVGANTAPFPTQNGFQIVTTLNNGDDSNAIALAGSSSIAPITPASLVSASLSTNALPAAGGDITVNTVVSVPAGNAIQYVYAYRNGGAFRLAYQSTNADGTQNYSGAINIPANTTGVTLTDLYTVAAFDSVGNYAPVIAGQATVGTSGAIVINSATFSASAFPSAGGQLTVSAVITPAYPYYIPNYSYIPVYGNVGGAGYLAYFGTNADGSQNWMGSVPVAANVSDAPRSDYYYLSAQDSPGNYVPYALGTVTVAPLGSLSVATKSLSATSYPAAGGNITISAKANFPVNSPGPGFSVFSNGVYLGELARQSANADGSINYAASFPVAANVSDQSRADYYYGEAHDNLSNYAPVSFGNVIVGPATPVSITQAMLSTSSLGVTGGDVILNVTTNAPAPNAVPTYGVYAYSNGQGAGYLNYQNTNADGTRNYSGSFHIGANSGATLQSYIYTVSATDNASNIALGVLGAVSVDTVPATVAGKVSLEGLVPIAASQTLRFQFRLSDPGQSDDGTVALNTTAAVSPDGFFNLTNIPRRNYNLWIKGPKNLAKVVTVNTLNSDAHSVTALLRAGDSNDDNSVDSSDFTALIGSFNSAAAVIGNGYDPLADFNGDGYVDSTDFTLLIGNFNQVGDM